MNPFSSKLNPGYWYFKMFGGCEEARKHTGVDPGLRSPSWVHKFAYVKTSGPYQKFVLGCDPIDMNESKSALHLIPFPSLLKEFVEYNPKPKTMKYKLIKKYPGSPPVGTEFTVEFGRGDVLALAAYKLDYQNYRTYIPYKYITENPEFWQSIETARVDINYERGGVMFSVYGITDRDAFKKHVKSYSEAKPSLGGCDEGIAQSAIKFNKWDPFR